MKCALAIVCLGLCVALTTAAPTNDATIVSQTADVRPDGYTLQLETSDGTKRSEEAILNNIGTEDEAISVKGTYSYVGDDGVTYQVNFVADQNGYQPEGAHIPKV
ncbi:PREDICTED: cuticle protein CP14.6-like [Drosophila arizonae]|uniref:Cuticle protein CP14.6-like n=1 Tax=Drosophila arizonae TaxID=7263 RepID=A0ABM1P6X9_DROAR|nr:PREDICTED: cuticle protein CP14.6-like [Drosophila arizonae]